jgi:hypothetical protein
MLNLYLFSWLYAKSIIITGIFVSTLIYLVSVPVSLSSGTIRCYSANAGSCLNDTQNYSIDLHVAYSFYNENSKPSNQFPKVVTEFCKLNALMYFSTD